MLNGSSSNNPPDSKPSQSSTLGHIRQYLDHVVKLVNFRGRLADTQDMLGHLGINVPGLAAAKRYYDALMPLVGFETFFATDDEFSYKPADNKPGTFLFFYPTAVDGPYSSEQTGLQHLAFIVRRRSVVEQVHDHVVAAGGSVIYAPQPFPQYPGHYYATFWLDPFGIKLEAVCHHDRD